MVKTLSSIGTIDKNHRPLYIHTYTCVCSVVSDSATPWTAALKAPLSMEFSRRDYWSNYIYIYIIYLWLGFLEEMNLNFKLAIRLSEIKEQN